MPQIYHAAVIAHAVRLISKRHGRGADPVKVKYPGPDLFMTLTHCDYEAVGF